MTTFTLDIAKWRCGGNDVENSRTKLGNGETLLLNEDGYMCCLGQFLQQIGVPSEELLDVEEPISMIDEVKKVDKEEVILFYDDKESEDFRNTELTLKCIDINDTINTSVIEKVNLLKEELNKHGHDLKILNEYLIP